MLHICNAHASSGLTEPNSIEEIKYYSKTPHGKYLKHPNLNFYNQVGVNCFKPLKYLSTCPFGYIDVKE